MAIEYSFKTEREVLVVEAKGFDESLQEVIDYNKAVKDKAVASGCGKVIADERKLEYRLSFTDTYSLGKHTSEIARVFKKIAIVTNKDNQESAQFWEDVAYNRGVMVKVFYSLEDAMSWL